MQRQDTDMKWMVLYFGKMYHDSAQISTESFTPENKVPIMGESIAKTVKNGYNSSKTNLQKRWYIKEQKLR